MHFKTFLCLSKTVLFAAFILCSVPLYASNHDIFIVTSNFNQKTQEITENLIHRIPAAQLLSNLPTETTNKNSIYLAIGPTALRNITSQKNIDGIIISLFTSSLAYNSILETNKPPKAKVTAIYAEPSPLNQMRLISLINGRSGNVAVILSDETTYLDKFLRSAAEQTKFNLTIEKFGAGESINRVLNRISSSPFILATPDGSIYTNDNIRNILLTGYRHGQAFIGFNQSLVDAGAIASTYSGIDDINSQAEEMIAAFSATGKLPEPQFPRYFSTQVNETVAKTLNIVIGDEVRTFSKRPAKDKNE